MTRAIRLPGSFPALLAGMLLLAMAPAAGAQSSSTGWRLTSSTVNAGGGASVSPTGTAHRLVGSVGQESVVGASSGSLRTVQSGFWSFAGSTFVPVFLTLEKDTTTKTAYPDLLWTGNSATYRVHRSTNPATLASSFLFSQSGLTWSDVAPPSGADLVCYSVDATAPGPVAPTGTTGGSGPPEAPAAP